MCLSVLYIFRPFNCIRALKPALFIMSILVAAFPDRCINLRVSNFGCYISLTHALFSICIQSYIVEFIVHTSEHIYIITAAKQKLLAMCPVCYSLLLISRLFNVVMAAEIYLQFHLERSFSISKCSKLILAFFCLPELPSTL